MIYHTFFNILHGYAKIDSSKIDLVQIARQAMFAKGLSPDFPPDALAQLDKMHSPIPCSDVTDMTQKLWFSIDNDDSRDSDQLTYAERINDRLVRVYVAIADVDALVQKNTPIDRHALINTTSVYTPMIIFPMLPEKLSNKSDFAQSRPKTHRHGCADGCQRIRSDY